MGRQQTQAEPKKEPPGGSLSLCRSRLGAEEVLQLLLPAAFLR